MKLLKFLLILDNYLSKFSNNGCYFVVCVICKPPHVDYKSFIDSLETSLPIALSYSDNIVCIGDVKQNF